MDYRRLYLSWILTYEQVALAPVPANALAALPQSQDERPLRSSEPLEAVVSDLEGYIQERMAEDGIPGLSVALVRDFQVVWTAGFGVKNKIGGGSVTPATAFEAASIWPLQPIAKQLLMCDCSAGVKISNRSPCYR